MMLDDAFLKVKIMDNIHKYYYLIVFTAYMREMAEVARTTMTDEQKAIQSVLSLQIINITTLEINLCSNGVFSTK